MQKTMMPTTRGGEETHLIVPIPKSNFPNLKEAIHEAEFSKAKNIFSIIKLQKISRFTLPRMYLEGVKSLGSTLNVSFFIGMSWCKLYKRITDQLNSKF